MACTQLETMLSNSSPTMTATTGIVPPPQNAWQMLRERIRTNWTGPGPVPEGNKLSMECKAVWDTLSSQEAIHLHNEARKQNAAYEEARRMMAIASRVDLPRKKEQNNGQIRAVGVQRRILDQSARVKPYSRRPTVTRKSEREITTPSHYQTALRRPSKDTRQRRHNTGVGSLIEGLNLLQVSPASTCSWA